MTEANALPSGHQLRRALAHLLIELHIHVLPAVRNLHDTQQVSVSALWSPLHLPAMRRRIIIGTPMGACCKPGVQAKSRLPG